jgi:hypothetical protein
VSNSVTNPVSPGSSRIPADHARHDRLLVSRFAADDAYPTESADARALVDTCAQCAALAADIRIIRSATAALPAPVRPRDFRLSVDQAENLRGSAVERFLRRLAAPGLAPLRPVAGVAMSLGLALAVVGAALPMPAAIDQDGAATFQAEQMGEGREAPAPAGEEPAEAPAEAPAAGEPEVEEPQAAGGSDDVALEERAADAVTAGEQPGLRDLLVYAGLVLTILSLAVLVVVSIARRRWVDPLLR